MNKKKNVMIYSSQLGGHRQVYCNAFIDVFLELSDKILLAVGIGVESGPFKHVEHYRFHPKVKIIDTCPLSFYGDGKLSIEQIVQLQKDYEIKVSLFTFADEMVGDLKAINEGRAPQLCHQNIGIFLFTERWFPREVFFASGLSLRKRCGNLWRRSQGIKEYYSSFYERTLQRERILDAALVADERVVKFKGEPFYWFQDVYRPFSWEDDEETRKEYDEVVPDFERFLRKQEEREVLLYFGIASYRKGYDLLLNLALNDHATCFVHCGAPYLGGVEFEIDVRAAREELLRQGRYFETGRWINSWKVIERFWESIQRFVLTRRDYRTSGTMLQALNAGKPILAPNGGLIRYRTLQNGLGELYRPNNFKSLLKKWLIFKNKPTSYYEPKIKAYMENYTKDALVKTFASILT